MGIFKSLTYALLSICLFSLNQAKASSAEKSAILAELQNCFEPVARSIFEQVAKMPYEDKYEPDTGRGAQFPIFTSDRNCDVPTNPRCLEFQATGRSDLSWGHTGFRIGEIPYYSLRISFRQIPKDPLVDTTLVGRLFVEIHLKSGSFVYLETREPLPYLQETARLHVVGYDYLGREIIEPLGPSRFDLVDMSSPLSAAAILYNGANATGIRVDLLSYGACIRNILK